MKIGILTLPFNNNYGGFLQEYALMTVLKRMGHDVWFIDLQLNPQRSLWNTHSDFIKRFIKKYILKKDNIHFLIPSKERRYNELNRIIAWQHTRPFVDKYLCPKISPVYSSEELTYVIDKVHFDAFISGSDQIWRPRYMSYFLKTAYFDFLEGRKEKRITYAASFGVDEWEYSPELTKNCAELIKKIDAVSVREESGIALCKKYFGIDAQWVLDPTMLLEKEDYETLFENAQTQQSPGDLFCYILDNVAEKQELIDHTARQLSLTPFCIGRRDHYTNVEDKVTEPVEMWLRGFYDAKFVITDSFHGIVFSILFNKPFVVCTNKMRGNTRIDSLLKIFDIDGRLVTGSDYNGLYNLDYSEINRIIAKERAKSITYLSNALQ